MLPLESVSEFVEARLAAGEDHTDAIVDAAYAHFAAEIDMEAAKRSVIKRRVSLAVSQMHDADGERVAFSSRDAAGNKTIVHLGYADDPTALYRAAHIYDVRSKSSAKIRDRLMERAGQLTLMKAA